MKVMNPSKKMDKKGQVLIVAVAGIFLVIAFALVPLPRADDWETFYGAAQRVLDGTPLYGTKITFSHYYNPPWLAVLFAPLALLSPKWSVSVISVVSLFLVLLLCWHWKLGILKVISILLSPPIFYLLLHGNVDAIILGGVLLPRECWLLVAMTKPQTAIALGLGVLQGDWKKTALITGSVLFLSFLFFGNWPAAILSQPKDMVYGGHNLFLHTWPYNIIIGVILAYLGWKKKDEKYLVGASPFFSPYAATSSLIGPLMLVIALVKDWQAVLIVTAYWIWSIWIP